MRTFLKHLFEPGNNGPEVAKLLSDMLDIKISGSTLKKEIEEHPDYPGLLSISDTLNAYGIENLTARFANDKFTAIPTPFITQIKSEKKATDFFTVVRKINGDSVDFFDPDQRKWTSRSKSDFLKKHSGVVLLAEAAEGAGEKEYDLKIREEKRSRIAKYLAAICLPLLLLFAGIVAFIQNGTTVLFPLAFSILTLSGSIVCVLLFWSELDQFNPALQQICNAGKKTSCGAILHSKAAKIAGISWSTIGFTYFTGELLLLLFGGIRSPQTLFLSAWLNVLAVPYVFYSLYYQGFVARQWCMLCLCIQSLLILQLATSLMGGWHTLSINAITPESLTPSITAFVLPFLSISLLLPALHKAKENKQIKAELQRLKHNPQIFDALLSKQKAITEGTDGLGILLGSPNATHKIIKVCNPYCGPCAKAHTPMEALLHNNQDVQVQILFTATNAEGDLRASPVKHLLAIAEKGDEMLVKQALGDWYLAEEKDYETFAAKYPMNGELKMQDEKLDAMEKWCDKAGVSFTPTFFVNGHQLPEIYSVSDLKHFLSI